MKDVYIKYWKDISMLYSFAFVLDPRAKLKGFNKLLRLLNKFLGVDYSSYLTEVRAQLNIMYKRYDDKFGTVKRRTPTQPTTAGKKKSAWDDIFADDVDDDTSDIFSTPGHGNSYCTPPLSLSRRTSASALLQAASTSASAGQ